LKDKQKMKQESKPTRNSETALGRQQLVGHALKLGVSRDQKEIVIQLLP